MKHVTFDERVTLNENGRIVIPAAMRKALKVKPGDELLLHYENGSVQITTRMRAVAEAQALVRRYIPKGGSLADELIAERRAAAKRE